jgi:hypothetical protein
MILWFGADKNNSTLGVDILCISWISGTSDPGLRYSITSYINITSKISSLIGILEADDTMNSDFLQYFFAIFNALISRSIPMQPSLSTK